MSYLLAGGALMSVGAQWRLSSEQITDGQPPSAGASAARLGCMGCKWQANCQLTSPHLSSFLNNSNQRRRCAGKLSG